MSFLIPTNAVQIARFANGLYGAQLGFASTNGIVSDVASAGLIPKFNEYYSLSFGAQTTAAVAQQIVTNLGIVAGSNGQTASSVSAALAYVTGQLNAAAPAARGAAVKAVLDLWSTISADPVNAPTYGAAATTWNSQISRAVQYAGAVNPDLSIAAAAALPVPPVTFALTSSSDNVVGTAGNDQINGVGTSTLPLFSAGDSLDGGDGIDTLTWVQTGAAVSGAPGASTVKNVEKINFSVDAFAVTLNTVTSTAGFTGLTDLNVINNSAAQTITVGPATNLSITDTSVAATDVTSNGGLASSVTTTGGTTGVISVGATTAPLGAVTVSDTTSLTTGATAGTITTTGGTTVSITQTNDRTGYTVNQTATQGAVTVTGTSRTTSVSVTQSGNVTAEAAVAAANANTVDASVGLKGNVAGAVTINDANAGSSTASGTITDITLRDFGNTLISANALQNLTLAGTGARIAPNAATLNFWDTGTIGITDGLSAPKVTTLNLNLGGGSIAAITDTSNKFSTINAVLTASTALSGGFTDTALRTLNVSGTGVLTMGAINTNITSVNVSGAAGFSGSIVGMGVTAFDGTKTTAANTVTLTSTTQTYAGGSGADLVTIAADATKSISGGAGTADRLTLSSVTSTYTAANTGVNTSGFEILSLSALTGNVLNMANLGTGNTFSRVRLSNNAGNNTLTSVPTGAVIEITPTALLQSTGTHNISFIDTLGAAGVANLTLTGYAAGVGNAGLIGAPSGVGSRGYTTAAVTLQDASSVGPGTLNLISTATVGAGVHNITTLTDTKLSTLNLTGSGAVVITTLAGNTATSLTVNNNTTSTVASTIGTVAGGAFTDAALTALTIAGSNNTRVLVDTSASAFTFTDNSTGATANATGAGSGITTLTSTNGSLSALTLAGTKAIFMDAVATTSSILTITNVNTSPSTEIIAAITDQTLTTLQLAGSGKTTISLLTDNTNAGGLTILSTATDAQTITSLAGAALTSLTVANSGTSTMTIPAWVATAATTINLLGSVALTATNIAADADITVGGSSDNANVSLAFIGQAGARTNTVTLGNGNNTVTRAAGGGTTSSMTVTFGDGTNTFTDSTVGTQDIIRVGSGTNTISLSSNAGGANGDADSVTFTKANGGNSSVFTTITGATATGGFFTTDTIGFANAASTAVITNNGAATSIAAGVAAKAASGFTTFTNGGNTYIYESTGTVANDQFLCVVGIHTFTATTTVLTWAS